MEQDRTADSTAAVGTVLVHKGSGKRYRVDISKPGYILVTRVKDDGTDGPYRAIYADGGGRGGRIESYTVEEGK